MTFDDDDDFDDVDDGDDFPIMFGSCSKKLFVSFTVELGFFIPKRERLVNTR